jgi:hypothetical protein
MRQKRLRLAAYASRQRLGATERTDHSLIRAIGSRAPLIGEVTDELTGDGKSGWRISSTRRRPSLEGLRERCGEG